MISLIFSRVLQSFVVMLGVAIIAFTLFTFVGDPISNLVGIQTSEEKREQLRESLGLNDPVPVQFVRFINRARPTSLAVCRILATGTITPRSITS